MYKISTFAGVEGGVAKVIPLFNLTTDSYFEKVAAPQLLPDVARYIEKLKPLPGSQYVLDNALGAGEYFGCFPAGTLIQTSAGELPIESVQPGAQVVTHRNRLRKVLAIKPKVHRGALTDLYLQGLPLLFPSLTATSQHEVRVVPKKAFVQARQELVYKGDRSVPVQVRRECMLQSLLFDWVPIEKLQRGDYVAQPFPLEEDTCALGEGWDDLGLAFLFGLYAAEGCVIEDYAISVDGYRFKKLRKGFAAYPLAGVVFIVGEHEESKVERARAVAEAYGYSLFVRHTAETHSFRVELHWQAFAEMCVDHIGRKSTKKRLSRAILLMPRAWQWEFFSAYADGDGCLAKAGRGKGSINIVSVSPALLMDMRLLLARQGVVASLSGRHNKKATWYNGNPIFSLLVGGSQISGKNSRAKSYVHPGGFLLSAVHHTKTQVWIGEVFDLQVEEDCSYTASGITVHNSNINADYFTEVSLIHRPEEWTGNPAVDKVRAKDWPYGFPTFYNAHLFQHHRNKDPSRAYGEIELAAWNPHMHRVELVLRVDKDKCEKFGGIAIWDKLLAGMFPDTSMGCSPPGTHITLANGSFCYIENVHKADLVLTHSGEVQPVTSVMKRHYTGTLYTFKAYGFRRALPLTGEHPVWLVRGEDLECKPVNSCRSRKQWHCTPLVKKHSTTCAGCSTKPTYQFQWVPAENVRVGDYVAFPVPTQVDPSVASIEEARFLGYYLAEGHIRPYNEHPLSLVVFNLNIEEYDLAQEIERLARVLGASVVWHEETPERGGRSVHVVQEDLARKCICWCGMYSQLKCVSPEVLYMPQSLQLHFLGAYLDGDGGTYKGSAYFSTASEQLSEQLFLMLARCEIISSVNKIEHKPSEKSVVQVDTTEYQVWVGTDFSGKLAPYTSKPVRSSKKVHGVRFFYQDGTATYLMAPVMEIEESTYAGDVFNFSVDSSESYVAEHLAVHNCRVPFDTCCICLDWKRYKEAQSTFDPKIHKSPGDAVLAIHKKNPIRGVSVTVKDYCEDMRKNRNRILSDGRKVFVYNDYPKFFDDSIVFIGADRTAKIMMKIASPKTYWYTGSSAEVAERLGYHEDGEKTAAIAVTAAEAQKRAAIKRSEIVKEVREVPGALAERAVPELTAGERDLPPDVLQMLSNFPLHQALSTAGGMGVVLRPREFQRIVLVRNGMEPLADAFDEQGITPPCMPPCQDKLLDPSSFVPLLAAALSKIVADRSAHAPHIEARVLIVRTEPQEKTAKLTSPSLEVLCKIGTAYASYREQLMDFVSHTNEMLNQAGSYQEDFRKLSTATPEELFSPLSVAYLRTAFLNELVQH